MAKKPTHDNDTDTDNKTSESPGGSDVHSLEYKKMGEPVSVTQPGDHSADNKPGGGEADHGGTVAGVGSAPGDKQPEPTWGDPATASYPTPPNMVHPSSSDPTTADPNAPPPPPYPLEDGEPPMPANIRFESGTPEEFVAWLKEWSVWKASAPATKTKKD